MRCIRRRYDKRALDSFLFFMAYSAQSIAPFVFLLRKRKRVQESDSPSPRQFQSATKRRTPKTAKEKKAKEQSMGRHSEEAKAMQAQFIRRSAKRTNAASIMADRHDRGGSLFPATRNDFPATDNHLPATKFHLPAERFPLSAIGTLFSQAETMNPEMEGWQTKVDQNEDRDANRDADGRETWQIYEHDDADLDAEPVPPGK